VEWECDHSDVVKKEFVMEDRFGIQVQGPDLNVEAVKQVILSGFVEVPNTDWFWKVSTVVEHDNSDFVPGTTCVTDEFDRRDVEALLSTRRMNDLGEAIIEANGRPCHISAQYTYAPEWDYRFPEEVDEDEDLEGEERVA
jgi:hypothetical protein